MASSEPGSLDEVARLLALLVRLQVNSQTQAILELSRIGIGPSRVAELLGTSAATARVTVNQSKSKSKATKAKS